MRALTANKTIEKLLADPFVGIGLTDREREVARLSSRGWNGPEIAEKLDIGRATVKTHLRAIRRKLGVVNLTEYVIADIEAILKGAYR
jgi:DNA-binding NarL/FixJ family response regulator